jgi:hydroxymethylpyrimidine pyrophosphatase-like HAD family hydrolase
MLSSVGRGIVAFSVRRVMAVGDNYNDVEMLAFAGVPFIMGMHVRS